MIGVLVGLLLAQSVPSQQKKLDAAIAAGRFAEVEQGARKLLDSNESWYPEDLSRLTRALAEQDKCAATRAALTGSLHDRFLAAQLDTASGNFASARVAMSSAVDQFTEPADGGRADPSLANALELLELLERLTGDPVRAAELGARGLELRVMMVYPEPFDGAVSTLNFALEQKNPARALNALTNALALLEESAGPRHALVRVALQRRAALYERQGQMKSARRERERALEVAKAAWCR